ncbi:MAG: amino acid permease [Methanobacteriota archaeon]|nr:MAG: amino acid permease [Euryarchaeota archaeon]
MAQEQSTRVEITLSRDLRLLDITMIGIGAMIGAGIFVLMGSAKEVAGSAAIIALVLNGFVTFITAMSYAELGSCFPQAGGVYLWAREGLPAPAGFLSGWMSWTAAMIACSLYAVGFGGFVAFLTGATGAQFFLLTKIIAILIVLFFVFVNYWGAQTTGKTEGIITISKIVVLGAFIVAGFVQYAINPALGSDFVNQFFTKGGGTIFLAMGLTFVAFEGYEIIAQSGEEVKNPKRNIPRAIFISIAVSVILYVLVFYIAYPKLEAGEAGSETAMLRAGWELFGVSGYILMVIGGLLSTTSALNATIYSSSRVSFAMGRDKVIPTKLGEVNEKRRTPAMAVIVSGGLIIMMAMVPAIETIAAAAGIMFLLLFAIANACVITLRKKRPDLDRGFRVPLVPIIPIIGIFLNIALAVGTWFLVGGAGALGPGQIAWYLALAWIIGGLAIHYPTGGRRAIAELGMERRKELLELLAEEKKKVDKKEFRVMVPLSDLGNEELVRFASLVAEQKGGELALMNVYEVPPSMPPKAVTFSMVSSRIKRIERLERLARKREIKTRAIIKIGHRPYQNILDAIEEEAVDVLVMGWRGRPVGGRRILGSNIDHMVQTANCDVVVFKTAGLPEKINNILIVSGRSWHASYATNMAIAIAKEHQSEITILTVVEDKAKEEKDVKYSERLMGMCEKAGITARHEIVYARTAVGAVVGEAAKHDLIVMGASEEWKRREYAFGRITDQLAKKIDNPVLMFRKDIQRKSNRETEP